MAGQQGTGVLHAADALGERLVEVSVDPHDAAQQSDAGVPPDLDVGKQECPHEDGEHPAGEHPAVRPLDGLLAGDGMHGGFPVLPSAEVREGVLHERDDRHVDDPLGAVIQRPQARDGAAQEWDHDGAHHDAASESPASLVVLEALVPHRDARHDDEGHGDDVAGQLWAHGEGRGEQSSHEEDEGR